MNNDYSALNDTLINFAQESFRRQNFNIPNFINVMESVFKKNGFRDEHDENEQFNILVIRLDAIGDSILNSAFLRELRRNYLSARITLIVNQTVYPIVEFCPYVNEIIAIPSIFDLAQFLPLALKLCNEKLWDKFFDVCFVPRWDIDYYFAQFLSYLSGAKIRIGYSADVHQGKKNSDGGANLFLNKTFINPQNLVHEVERNLYVLKACGLQVQDDKIEVWYNHRERLNIESLLKNFAKDRKLISIVNGGSEKNKNYPKELFLKALKIISRKHKCNFVYLGGKEYFETGEYLRKNLDKNKILNLAGKTSLRETCAIISMSSMYVGTDTGTMHITAALNKPVIMLERQAEDMKIHIVSSIIRFCPWQTQKIIVQPKKAFEPCRNRISISGCVENFPHCITQIKPESIADAFDELNRTISLNESENNLRGGGTGSLKF